MARQAFAAVTVVITPLSAGFDDGFAVFCAIGNFSLPARDFLRIALRENSMLTSQNGNNGLVWLVTLIIAGPRRLMGKLTSSKYRQILKKLKKLGLKFDRQAAGSHEI
jgi:hypothetical protein